MPRYHVTVDGKEFDISLEYRSEQFQATINGRAVTVKHTHLAEGSALLLIDNESLQVEIHSNGGNGERSVFMGGVEISASVEDYALAQMRKVAGISHGIAAEDVLKAPMPGLVIEIKTAVGEQVAKDQPLVVVEAMKMENIIKAKHAAKVKAVRVKAGASVEKGDVLLEFE